MRILKPVIVNLKVLALEMNFPFLYKERSSDSAEPDRQILIESDGFYRTDSARIKGEVIKN